MAQSIYCRLIILSIVTHAQSQSNTSNILVVKLTPSNSASVGAKVNIYEEYAVDVNASVDDGWYIDAEADSHWILGVSLNKTIWGFPSSSQSNITIEIQVNMTI